MNLGTSVCCTRRINTKRVLIVVAHPDDVYMFFGPTICRLINQGANVHILCVSSGKDEGNGQKRRTELWAACHELGVPDENICIITDSRFQDDPKIQWPVHVVAKVIHRSIESLDINILVTFNRIGLTSHVNHSALFFSVAYMFMENLIPKRCKVYTLDSVNKVRKNMGYLDLPLSCVLSSKRYFLRCTEICRIVRAMKRHHSQIVWSQYLSRYIVINTLRKINLDDVEHEINMHNLWYFV